MASASTICHFNSSIPEPGLTRARASALSAFQHRRRHVVPSLAGLAGAHGRQPQACVSSFSKARTGAGNTSSRQSSQLHSKSALVPLSFSLAASPATADRHCFFIKDFTITESLYENFHDLGLFACWEMLLHEP